MRMVLEKLMVETGVVCSGKEKERNSRNHREDHSSQTPPFSLSVVIVILGPAGLLTMVQSRCLSPLLLLGCSGAAAFMPTMPMSRPVISRCVPLLTTEADTYHSLASIGSLEIIQLA